MNPLLQKKLAELENAQSYECWYLVKQPTAFASLCYLVSFLKAYKQQAGNGNLEDFIGERIAELRSIKPNVEISNNYRALRVAAFFGLITITSGKYDEAGITDVFEEISSRCNGEFEKIDLYSDIIQKQIEKMYISSPVDEEYNGVRKEYRLFPVMLLYKVLLELGKSTGEYFITMTEYRYLVATTKVYEEFLDTLLLIKLLREDADAGSAFEKYRTKFDNRMIQALKQLPTLEINQERIALKESCIEEVAKRVFLFESHLASCENENYLEFLGSVRTFEDIIAETADFSDKINFCTEYQSRFERNRIIFGAPGTGKSYILNKQKNELLGENEFDYERVTFHPGYSYANFVGTYKPISGKDSDGKDTIRYEYVPGPFMRIYVKALKNSREKGNIKPFLLLIEEINRANVAAVFGDVFQLLDRDGQNVSEYAIWATEDMKKYLAEQLNCSREEISEIKIPDNMFIWATMNSADQGVFPVDTAFKRRWEFEYIGVDDGEAAVEGYIIPIGMGDKRKYVKWNDLRKRINKILLSGEPSVNEDKLLGPFFLSKNVLDRALTDEEHFIKAFESKVLMYLFEDVMKMRPSKIFGGHGGRMIFSEICRTFEEDGVGLFGIKEIDYMDRPAQ